MNYETEVVGKQGIVARVVQSSVYHACIDKPIYTFEVEYPRWILAELNTHCMLEKNSSSSRAVPVLTQLDLIANNPAMPIAWCENKSGMVAGGALDEIKAMQCESLWIESAKQQTIFSKTLHNLGLHKQWSNRLTEPFQFMKTVITATELKNFFYLRMHKDAQPEFKELATCMFEAMQKAQPEVLFEGEWHVPYVDRKRGFNNKMQYFVDDVELTPEQAKKVSASCCAQTSYRKADFSLEKAERVFDMLNIGSTTDPAHASPITHQATPVVCCEGINEPFDPSTWQAGVTHTTKEGGLWSGKFKQWVQFRKLVPNEAVW